MRYSSLRLAAFVAAISVAPSIAFADDWVATKLRGSVVQRVGNEWVALKRGDVVPDSRVIRTMKSGRVSFERGEETIELAGETQIQIIDKAGRQFTTVKQQFGTVTIEAEVQNVQHFAVVTPHLAAVVKGTRFIVTSDEDTAQVKVKRGHVAVEDDDTHQTTLLSAGQSATTSDGGEPLEVAGTGELPIVYGVNGKPVTNIGQASTAAAAKARADALADGATSREAAMAAKAAREAAKEEAKESKAAEKDAPSSEGSSGSGNSGGGNSGNSGGGPDSGGGKKDK